MAQIIHVCMTCQKLKLPAEFARGDAPHLKKDELSHGYCPQHGEEWLADIRRQNDERKRILCVGRIGK